MQVSGRNFQNSGKKNHKKNRAPYPLSPPLSGSCGALSTISLAYLVTYGAETEFVPITDLEKFDSADTEKAFLLTARRSVDFKIG